MNLQEFEKIKELSYSSYCEYLIDKNGKVPYDYFTSDYTKDKRNSRTIDGLFIHHIFENKIANLSQVEIAKENAASYQSADNLLYCDWLEHIWLHILIAKEDATLTLGIGGALTMQDILVNLYDGEENKLDWVQNCFDKIKDDQEVFELIQQEIADYENNLNERIVLFEHNQQVYDELELYLKDDNKALVLLGTGLGKTTTALEYLKQHHVRGLVLCPTNVIRSSWDSINEVDTMTYAGFCNKYKTIDYSQYGAVILDEAHHCGGAKWGEGPHYLIDNNIIKVIGLTATNIRTDGKDIGGTLFGGNVCRGLNVLEGIEQGILHPFSYVGAIYDTDSIKKEYHEKNVDEELLGELDLALNNTPTLKKILTDNMPDGPRKGIIFVSNIAAIDEARTIMEDIYPDVEYRAIHSLMSEKEVMENKEWFEHTNEGYLFSINMVSEGAHYRGVNTLIMFRRTCSSLVFNQQLGRVIALAKYENPNAIVFDLVNNAKVVQEFKPFLENLRVSTERRQSKNKTYSKSEQIIIKDYCADIVDILNEIKQVQINSKVSIYQIDPLSFSIIREFDSVNEAQRYFNKPNLSAISACLCDKRFSAYGFCWCRKDKWYETWQPKVKKQKRAIYQIEIVTLKVLSLFDSIMEAVEETQGSRGGILQCCKREIATSGGFHWVYYEDYSSHWLPPEKSFIRNRKIYCFETKTVYENAKEAAINTNANRDHILRVVKGYENAAGGFHFCYAEEKDSYKIKQDIDTSPCVCINTKEHFPTIHEAALKTNTNESGISSCCRGKTKTANNLSWCYEKNYDSSLKPFSPKNKPVRCIETNCVYNSSSEAARLTKIARSSIAACCNGKQKTAGQLHWEFVEE